MPSGNGCDGPLSIAGEFCLPPRKILGPGWSLLCSLLTPSYSPRPSLFQAFHVNIYEWLLANWGMKMNLSSEELLLPFFPQRGRTTGRLFPRSVRSSRVFIRIFQQTSQLTTSGYARCCITCGCVSNGLNSNKNSFEEDSVSDAELWPMVNSIGVACKGKIKSFFLFLWRQMWRTPSLYFGNSSFMTEFLLMFNGDLNNSPKTLKESG